MQEATSPLTPGQRQAGEMGPPLSWGSGVGVQHLHHVAAASAACEQEGRTQLHKRKWPRGQAQLCRSHCHQGTPQFMENGTETNALG